MNLVRILEDAVKKRRYPKVIKNLNKLCEELDYEVVGTCSPSINASFSIKAMEITPESILIIPSQTYSFTVGNYCRHYSNEGKEGIIYSLKFHDLRLDNLELYAYGKVWKGEMMLAQDRFKCIEAEEILRVPSIIKKVSLKELERVVRR